MKVLLSWLREFAPLDAPLDTISQALADLGIPVEEVVHIGDGLDGIVVAKVLDLRPHPNADKIQLVDVDTGDGEALQICCGAFNMAVGDLVPLATLGTVMPGGMKIERRKLRGEWSNGMLCSAVELGLGTDHGGIHILDGSLQPGRELADALGIVPDVMLELEVNPNRPDAMSVAGVARDLAAYFGVPFTLPSVEPPAAVAADPSSSVTVDLADAEGCGRFTVGVLRNVKVGPSPRWLANRLTALGMRPINNLVDISNYLMLELGQPSHPYDAADVEGRGFRIRRARDGETLTTLDDVERVLTTDDRVICDAADRPIGIAGVMGGATGEISEATTEVLVEMAWFPPMHVARTSRRLKLRTEAAIRFEKGCDPAVIELAQHRFAQLASELADAEPVPGLVEASGDLPDRSPIRVRTARVNTLLGTDLAPAEVRSLVGPIGFACEEIGDDHDVVAPSWRYDTTTEIEVVEEVARMYGYTRIPKAMPTAPRFGHLTERQQARRRVRRTLVGLGLSEAMPMPFLAPGQLERCGLDPLGIELLNPLVAEESVLRTSLRPGLLAVLAYNRSHRATGTRLFEVGTVFPPPPDGQLLPDEEEHLAVALAGREAPAAVEVWQVLVEALAVPGASLINAELPGLHPTRGATVNLGETGIGVVGEVDPAVLERHGIDERVAYLEVDLGAVLAASVDARPYRPVSRFPSSDIDLAFVVDDAVPATAVEATIGDAAGDLLVRLGLFDVFRSEQVGTGRRSLAYGLRLQSLDRTLTDADVAAVRDRVIDVVKQAHGAELRG
jgi:phenylalanyl-tRNA synthetase beta chain